MASLAALLEAERARLADSVGASSFAIAPVDDDHCRIMTDEFTVHFYRQTGDWPIHSSLELASVPRRAMALTDHLHTWLLLKSRGEDWPQRGSPDPLAAELERVARAIPVLRDEAMLAETLIWEAGYMDGYGSWGRPPPTEVSGNSSGTAEPGPRVADLVREERAMLEEALKGAPYELREEDIGTCRVVTDRFDIAFGWWWRERWITAAIRLNRPPRLPLEFDFDIEYETRTWLEAAGIVTAPPRTDFRSASLVRDELEILRQLIAEVFSDDRKAREASFYLAGNQRGYNDRVVVPEDLPPLPVIAWTEQELRRRGHPVTTLASARS